MTQKEKQLLLEDLCMRIPYRTFVCLNPGAYNKPETCILTGVHGEKVHLNVDSDPFRVDHIKPYLRPMSSMTEEEKKEFKDTFNGFFQYFNHGIISDSRVWDKNEAVFVGELSCSKLIDWLNAHHFDYRGLIPMGLALEAPEEMYKVEEE